MLLCLTLRHIGGECVQSGLARDLPALLLLPVPGELGFDVTPTHRGHNVVQHVHQGGRKLLGISPFVCGEFMHFDLQIQSELEIVFKLKKLRHSNLLHLPSSRTKKARELGVSKLMPKKAASLVFFS